MIFTVYGTRKKLGELKISTFAYTDNRDSPTNVKKYIQKNLQTNEVLPSRRDK